MTHRLSTLLLALLLCLCCVPAAQAQGEAALTLSSSAGSGYGGDEITVSLALTAENLGGLQTSLIWNSGYLTYVEGSAAFSSAFTSSSMTAMINDSTANRITLVYGNTNGYTAEDEVIFTARFLLKEGVNGETEFSLTGTKASDASADLTALSITTTPVTVLTEIFDAGSVTLDISLTDSYPRIGETVTVNVALSSCTEPVGSLQGTFKYNPNVLKLVDGSAVFSAEASAAAYTKMINTSTVGEVRFVFAAMNGYSEYSFITMEFEVIGGVDKWTNLSMENLKATNARTDHLALMNTNCWSNSLCPQGEPDTLYLTTHLVDSTYYYNYGDTITLGVSADGIAFGGLQATLTYDPEQLTYVPQSAAYSAAFKQGTSISVINDATAGQIKLVSTNPNGYTPDGSDIFTAQFVIKTIGTPSRPTLSAVKATNAGAELTTVPSSCSTDISWYVYRGEYDMSNVAWDYTEAFLYDGTEKSVRLTGLPEGLTPIYSNASATEPGSYCASVSFEYDEDHYYEPSMSSCWWSIEYLTFDMSQVSWDYTNAFVYDGTEKTIQLTGLPEGLTPVYSDNTATEPGTRYATVTFEYDTAHYYEPSYSGLYWTIDRRTFDMSNVAWDYAEPFIYDGTVKTVQLTGLPEGLTPIYYSNAETEPGYYYASVEFEYDTAHYYAPSFDDLYWGIEKADYDMSGVAWNYTEPFVYDGTTKTVELIGLPEGITPSYNYNSYVTPGSRTAYVYFSYDSVHYNEPTFDSLYWTIDKATFDMSNVAWDYTAPFTYDGTEKRVQLLGLPEGLEPQYSDNTAIDPGEYNATVYFSYNSSCYYAPASVEGVTWTIEPLHYDMSGVSWNYTTPLEYNGAEKRVELVNLPYGLTATYHGNVATVPGEYVASVTFESFLEGYAAPTMNACRWVILLGTFDMSNVAWNYSDPFTYDGTEKAVYLTGLPEGLTPIYSGNTATLPGDHYATVTFEYDASLYNVPLDPPGVTWTIEPLQYDMSGVSWNYTTPFECDGNTKRVELIGLPEGLIASYQNNEATNPGDYVASVVLESCIEGYAAPIVEDCCWSIVHGTFDMSNVMWSYAGPFTYDGTEKTVVLTGLPAGLVPVYEDNAATEPGDYFATVTFIYSTSYYNPPANVEGLAWTIEPLQYDMSGVSWNYATPFEYDGTEKRVELTGLPDGLIAYYDGNAGIEPGGYLATVTFDTSLPGHAIPEFEGCAWSIIPGNFDMSNVRWNYAGPFTYDGTEKVVKLIGLPADLVPVYEGNTGIEPGDYFASVAFSYNMEYYNPPAYVEGISWTIEPLQYDMSGVSWNYATPFEYDGTEKRVELTGLPEGLIAIYEGNTGIELGDYFATVTFESALPGYVIPEFVGCAWSICPAEFDMSGVSWNYATPFTCDGTEKTVELIGLPEGLIAIYEGNTAVYPGDYYASVTFDTTLSGYVLPEFEGCEWSIWPAEFDMSGVAWNYTGPFTYDGTEKRVELTGLPDGLIAIYESNTGIEPGGYLATVTFESWLEGYATPTMAGCAWSIIPGNFDMSNVRWNYAGPFTYDGTEKTVALTGLPADLVPVYEGNTGIEPGDYFASVAFSYNMEYYNPPAYVEGIAWTIEPLQYDMSGVSWNYATPFTYDGTEKRVELTGLPEGLIAIYEGNTGIELGDYFATVTFESTLPGYVIPEFVGCEWSITISQATELVLNPTRMVLSVNAPWNQGQMTWELLPAGCAEEEIVVESDSTLIEILPDGLIEAKAPGVATVIVRTADGRLSASCEVEILENTTTAALPNALSVIEPEAFRGTTALKAVILPSELTRIESLAFADSALRFIQIPASVTYIAPDAFDGSALEMICAPSGSYAIDYAKEHSILYVEQ